MKQKVFFPTWWRENRAKFVAISELWLLPKKWTAPLKELIVNLDLYLGL